MKTYTQKINPEWESAPYEEVIFITHPNYKHLLEGHELERYATPDHSNPIPKFIYVETDDQVG